LHSALNARDGVRSPESEVVNVQLCDSEEHDLASAGQTDDGRVSLAPNLNLGGREAVQ
jgi:hypothetical protein